MFRDARPGRHKLRLELQDRFVNVCADFGLHKGQLQEEAVQALVDGLVELLERADEAIAAELEESLFGVFQDEEYQEKASEDVDAAGYELLPGCGSVEAILFGEAG